MSTLSAQEIAESLAREVITITQNEFGPKRVRHANAACLSAIAAAVAQKEVELQDLQERYDLLAEMARDYDDRANRGQKDSAAVAQAKEEEPAMFRNLLRRLRDSIDECDSEALLQEIDSALELKEPAIESNLAIQNAFALAYGAAKSFIESHVADPEITAEMSDKYQAYQEEKERLERLLSAHFNAAGAAPVSENPPEAKEGLGEAWQKRVHQAYMTGKPLNVPQAEKKP